MSGTGPRRDVALSRSHQSLRHPLRVWQEPITLYSLAYRFLPESQMRCKPSLSLDGKLQFDTAAELASKQTCISEHNLEGEV